MSFGVIRSKVFEHFGQIGYSLSSFSVLRSVLRQLNRVYTPWSIKKVPLLFFRQLWQILTDFRNFFTTIFRKELWNKNLLKFSPHLKSVAALPCET